MAGRKIQTFRFAPRSVTDVQDGGLVADGALSAATDLIFDPANPFMLQCRPAAVQESALAGIAGAGVVSVHRVVGSMVYGMIASSAVAGRDVPFAYNLGTHALVTVTGTQDATTLPMTPATTGTWTPPTMALVGTLLYVTHPGFSGGAAAFFGWFDTADPAAPVWHAGNTTGTPLVGVPTAVGEFNNRAWFAYKNTLTFTDALTVNVTAATQVLTVGDSEVITAVAQQPILTNVQGIIQSLAVFKTNAIALVTGDAVYDNLSVNIISPESVGCLAGRTVASTARGLLFMATDGIRLLAQDGTLGAPNPDLVTPFITALTPSRASAGYCNGIYRISVQNGGAAGTPLEEYWFDEAKNGWTGPHSFIQSCCSAYEGTCIAVSNALSPALWVSDVRQSGASVFVENGSQMSFLARTSPLAESSGMYENSAVLSVVDMQLPNSGGTLTFVASDVRHGVLSTAQLVAPVNGNIWNGFEWVSANWSANSYGLDRYNIPWTCPLVFSRMVWQITGPASSDLKLGKLLVGYQPLGYVRTFP